jgi:hypothetical protein
MMDECDPVRPGELGDNRVEQIRWQAAADRAVTDLRGEQRREPQDALFVGH